MIFDASKIYLSILQKTLLTNDILITVMNLIEILPITLHIINSSFYLSSYQSPNEYTKYFNYCSYYDLFQEQFEKGYPLYLFIMMISILLIFCFYTFTILHEVIKYEKTYSYFVSLGDFFSCDCNTIFQNIQDIFISQMLEKYPQSNYYAMFSALCSQTSSLPQYKNIYLLMQLINYRTSALLNLYVGRSYEILHKINTDKNLFELFVDLQFIIRPLRRFILKYLGNEGISQILSNYNSIVIVFIVFSFSYEIIILLVVKFAIVNKIIRYLKEIVFTGKAFECCINYRYIFKLYIIKTIKS